MPWAKLDDGFWSNPKVVNAGNEIAGAYVRCLSYCACHLTDGYIPPDTMEYIVGRKRKLVRGMVEGKLVEELDNGYWIPDYLDYNMTADHAVEERAKARQRMAKLRAERRADVRANGKRGVR